MAHRHPLDFLLGYEGTALLHAWASDFDATLVEQRLAEIKTRLDTRDPGHHDSDPVATIPTTTGHRPADNHWQRLYLNSIAAAVDDHVNPDRMPTCRFRPRHLRHPRRPHRRPGDPGMPRAGVTPQLPHGRHLAPHLGRRRHRRGL